MKNPCRLHGLHVEYSIELLWNMAGRVSMELYHMFLPAWNYHAKRFS